MSLLLGQPTLPLVSRALEDARGVPNSSWTHHHLLLHCTSGRSSSIFLGWTTCLPTQPFRSIACRSPDRHTHTYTERESERESEAQDRTPPHHATTGNPRCYPCRQLVREQAQGLVRPTRWIPRKGARDDRRQTATHPQVQSHHSPVSARPSVLSWCPSTPSKLIIYV